MKQSHWLLCVGKELWLVEANHATVKFDFSWNENLQRRKKSTNSTILKRKCWKSRVRVYHHISLVSRKAWMFPWILQELKNMLRKLAIAVNLKAFDLSFQRKGALVTVEICVLCGRWFSNQLKIVSETPFSCDAVGRGLLWDVPCSLLCRELDWNICIGKQGCV